MNNHVSLPVLLGLCVFLAWACTAEVPPPVTPEYKTNLKGEEAEKNSAYKAQFPLQYATYMETKADGFRMDQGSMTEFGGNVPHEKHLCDDLPKGYKYCQPYLKNLWLGYPFSFEYNRARGHANAVYDVLEIDRINRYSEKAGLPSTCYNCKSNKVPGYVEKYGDDFWAMEFHQFREDHHLDDHSIGCNICHDPQDMSLTITSVPLKEALDKIGVDLAQASRNDMRSYVCAQCHVEYYFQDPAYGPAAKPVFPWEFGLDPEDQYAYYKSFGSTTREGFEGWFIDWTHAASNTPMVKVQHPEFETWYDGPHGAAGVSCADCHMPYTRMDGKKKISTHNVTSPLHSLETVQQACGQCHADKDPRYLMDRVIYTQEKTWKQLLIAQEESVRAHEAVRLASEYRGPRHYDYDALMIQARERVRKGQFMWDWVSAENSVGFHNPAKTLDTLASSLLYSRQAVDFAMQATNFAIANLIMGDIKEIVTPIPDHSRKLQQSQEHLDSHDWLKYLPKFDQADLVWDLNKRARN